jgi:hypothetical protein
MGSFEQWNSVVRPLVIVPTWSLRFRCVTQGPPADIGIGRGEVQKVRILDFTREETINVE